MRRMLIAMAAAMVLAGCARTERPPLTVLSPPAYVPVPSGWQASLSQDDSERLAALADTWKTLIAAARPRYTRILATQGALLTPEAARDFPSPPPGSYRCRLVRLRLPAARVPAVIPVAGESFCNIRGEDGKQLAFAKQTGSDLPSGWLHPDGSRRFVLLGARQRRPGDTALAYGSDATRDVAGVLERIGPFRWRLVLPLRDGATPGLDVYELTPVPVERQAPEPDPAPPTMAAK